MNILDDLGTKYGTDKAHAGHDYLVFYEIFFSPFRDRPIGFLEMGVGSGGSLATWRDYFQFGHIVGMDIQEDKSQYAGGRIDISIGDQARAEDLDRALAFREAFDIVNDDAGHNPDAQMFALKHILPRMAKGGLYVLEDIGSEGVTRFLLALAHRAVHDNARDDGDDFIREHGSRVEFVAFYKGTSVVKLK